MLQVDSSLTVNGMQKVY